MDRKIYEFNVTRDGKFWLIEVPELDQYTQARDLPEIKVMVKGLIATVLEVPPDSFGVSGTITLPGGVEGRLNTAMTLWLEADLEAGRAAQDLRDSQVTIPDIARLLGVSRAIARKLLTNADGVDRGRALVGDGPETKTGFVGPEDAAAKLETLMARPGMAGRVAEISAQMVAEDRAAADAVDDAGVDTP